MPEQLHRDMQEVAEQIRGARGDIARVEKKFDKRLDRERTVRRRRAWLLLAVAVLAFCGWATYEQNACERGNESRAQIREAFHVAAEDTGAPGLVEKIDADLADLLPPRECQWWPL